MKPEIDHLNEKLLAYLREHLDDASIAYQSHPVQLQGGFETHIYRFQLENTPDEFTQTLILRLYPAMYGTGNATWEYTIQNVLKAAAYPVAKAHLLCTDISILGGAFFIMDFLPGELMVNAPMELVPSLLGQNHAIMHQIDPDPLIQAIHAVGIDRSLLFLNHRYENLIKNAGEFPWLCKAVDWLVENRPKEPEQLAVCHGDFHPLNILVQDGQVTGVLDWPGFLIADPVLDIANTIVLSTIPFKHLAPTLGMDISDIDFEKFAEAYLSAYQTEKSFNSAHLDYYRVRRCVYALLEGAQGQSVWRHPLIIKDLLEFVHSISGLHINIPDL